MSDNKRLYFTISDDEACSGALSCRTRIRRGHRRDMPFIKNIEVPPIEVKIYDNRLTNVKMWNNIMRNYC